MTAIRPPRIAPSAFQKIRTPADLQDQIMAEYAQLRFEPTAGEATWDAEYGAAQREGISAGDAQPYSVDFAPVSADLLEACYVSLTPLMEAWAGCALERSWGYGIRSYGRGSVLHLHRDRVDTHVLSCIVHVDDRSDRPWALDFIDHDARTHQVTFEAGEALLYESLCPHARLTPFEGQYYRNMYLHWRPRGWDPELWWGLKSKYASIAECLAEMAGGEAAHAS